MIESASEMTYIVSGVALNSAHSFTHSLTLHTEWPKNEQLTNYRKMH